VGEPAHPGGERGRPRQGGGKTGNGHHLSVGCLVREKKAWFGWVGDSRGYVWRRGELHPTTSDHSLLNELLRTGRLSQDEAENFQHKNVITPRAGMAEQTRWTFPPGSSSPATSAWCAATASPGWWPTSASRRSWAQEPELQKACQRAGRHEANENGGVDNITVALVRYSSQ